MADPWYYGFTKDFEGFRDTPYKDTKGIPTIGYGFNMATDKTLPSKMTKQQADEYFVPKYKHALTIAQDFAGNRWNTLAPMQQAILADMAYNLGYKLNNFKKMRQAVLNQDNSRVVREMQNSDWYGQVGNRSKHHVANWYER